MLLKKRLKVLKNNKIRYIAMFAGAFLLLAPFAFLTDAIFLAIGNSAAPTLHTFCYRSPFDNLAMGKWAVLYSSVAAWLAFSVVGIALIGGPLFCGYLCPVGALSEGVSRVMPVPDKARLRFNDPKVTRSIRFGFLAGYIGVVLIVGYKLSNDVASVCCRYCASTMTQNIATGAFTGNFEAIGYWSSATLIVLISWLVLGGIFMSGGRGWCLFFCPLGAVSGIAHAAGSKLGMYKTDFNKEKCHDCSNCSVKCPMQAIGKDREVERTLCIDCHECVNNCNFQAYEYKRGKDEN